MKKLKLFVFGLLFMFVAVVSVNAQDLTNGKEANLRKCIKNTTDGVCTLIKNITVQNDDITIDLNGNTITFTEGNELWVQDGRDVTIKNGTIVQASDGYSAISIFYGNVTTSNLTINVTANPDEDGSPSAFWLEGETKKKGASLTVSADTTVLAPNGSGIGVPDGGLPVSATLNGTWKTKDPIILGTEAASTFNKASFTFNGGSYTSDGPTLSIYNPITFFIN